MSVFSSFTDRSEDAVQVALRSAHRAARRPAGGVFTVFERYAGLAVSALTLGLGALQILWDPNRQASHDKLAHTVVVRAPRRGLRK